MWEGKKMRTIGFALVPLITYFAQQLSYPFLPVDAYGHGFVVVAEQTSKGRV